MRKPTRSGGPRRPSGPGGKFRDRQPPRDGGRPRHGGKPHRGPREERDFGERPRFQERPFRSERHQDRDERRPPRGDQRPPRSEHRDRSERHERGEQHEPRRQDFPAKAERWGGEKRERFNKPRRPWKPPARDRDGPVFLYGWHSVKAALENPQRKFIRLLATENALHRLSDENIELRVDPDLVDAQDIDQLVGPDAVHQGLLAEVEPLPSPDIDDIDARGVILVLDQITDPHNVGAILRSAAAFAVTAVVTTLRHSPEMTGVLAKAASGALEYVPMITVPNLARALEALKKKNVFVIGLDSDGDASLGDIRMDGPTAIVVGAEGKGLRQLTRATCDQVARLDLPGKIRSLNVSNATALALYVATGGQQRS
jgi:23S rRNA (guanosine2251-2'-O)-methyltransferase